MWRLWLTGRIGRELDAAGVASDGNLVRPQGE